MKLMRSVLPRAAAFLLLCTILCGVLYTALITGFAQLAFPHRANGSIVEVGGVKYGSELLAQQYTDDTHLWGRIMNVEVSTFRDENGKRLLYAAPSNLSPASKDYAALVAQRVARIKAANPAMKETAIPVDLVTCSGSGLDPHISKAAAYYQVERLAAATGKSVKEIEAILETCSTGRLLGVFGEETVNVLKVNLMLDGIL